MSLSRFRTQHPLVFALAAFLLALLVLMTLGGETLIEQARQEAVTAAFVWIVLWAGVGKKMPFKRPTVTAATIIVIVLTAAVVGGIFYLQCGLSPHDEFYTFIPLDYTLSDGATIGALLVFFAFVALFEEGLFRGIFCPSLALEFRKEGKALPTLKAALVTASIFAIMHLCGQGAFRIQGIAIAQAVCKLLEATFFGLTMTGLAHSFNRLWPCVVVHLAYNLIMQGPMAVAFGVIPATYLSGIPGDLVAMVASTLVIAPAALISCLYLASLDRP